MFHPFPVFRRAMNTAVRMFIVCLLIVLCHEARTTLVPEEDVEAAKEMLTSFVLVEGNKEYRWLKRKSGEPSDEDTLKEISAVEGDILEPPGILTDEFNKRKVAEARNLWQNGIIPWAFNMAKRRFTDPKAFTLIQEVFYNLEKTTCLKFPRWSPERSSLLGPNYLDIGLGPGCASYVGYYGKGPQPVLLNQRGCMKAGVIMHEICHSLGFYHEHSRTDRDEYINILFKNVKTSAYSNFKIHSNSDNYVLYDLESIMHYGPLAFSRGSMMTIQPKDPNLSFLLGQRSQLSFYDFKTITEAYQCTRKCERPHQRCTNDGFLEVTCKCHCPFGLKGVDCSVVMNGKVCGGIITLTPDNEEATISFVSKSIGEKKKVQCFWLIKAPLLTQIRLDLVTFHLKKSTVCKQWLEIRYNMIGQQGPKYCGDSSGMKRTFDSTSNLVMLSLESIMVPLADAEFTMKVKLLMNQDADIKCTFELMNGMCIFHQLDNDDFDWRLMKGPTPSKYKGPVSGNNGSARYLYIQRSFARRAGDSAILESRYLHAGNKCITFHYNMYGKSVGRLTLNLITEKGDNLEVFEEKGSKNNDWKAHTFSLEAPLLFKLSIKATVGAGASGVIAIDDIIIKTGTCSKYKKTIDNRILTQIDCGFEEDECNFSWQPRSIAKVVTSSLTGDASLVGSLLIYTWSLKDGKEAIIMSPVVPYHGASCLSVDYYVIGVAHWNLSLSVADPMTNNQTMLWSSSGMKELNGRNNRITEEINESFHKIQIRLSVIVPNNSNSVSLLAIDHVRLTSSPCNKAQVRLPFACDFNQWCGFAPDTSGDWIIASKGVIFGPFSGSYFRKKSFLLYQGILSKSPGQSTVTSPPINLLGEGCLSFNFFARGILLKGIKIQQKTALDTSKVVWDSSKILLMVIWSHIQVPLMGFGEFRLIFSTIGKDMFANYAIDNLKLDPMPCTNN